MFKVVSTEENGEKLISAVPSSWEDHNILRWPRNKLQVKKIRKNPLSKPAEDWFSFQCSVKSANINSFEEASIIEKSLAAFSDTESEKRPKQRKNLYTADYKNFDNLFDGMDQPGPSGMQLNETARSNCKTEASHDELILMNDTNVMQGSSILPASAYEKELSNRQFLDSNAILSPTALNKEPNTECTSLQTVELDFSVLNRIPFLEKEVAGLHVKLDVMMNMISELKSSNLRKRRLSEDQTDDEEENIFPLLNVEDIYTFEERLKNMEFYHKIKKSLLRVVGKKNITGSGINAAYKLVDTIFSRSVLINFTWTGNSTIHDNKDKVMAFVSLKNTIKIFHDIVYEADRTFTYIDNEKFFKTRILKYAKARTILDLDDTKLRCSSKRNVQSRKKRLNTRED